MPMSWRDRLREQYGDEAREYLATAGTDPDPEPVTATITADTSQFTAAVYQAQDATIRHQLFVALRTGPPITVASAADTAAGVYGPQMDRLRKERAELAAENEILRVRAAGADSRANVLSKRIARVRQMAAAWKRQFPGMIRAEVAADAVLTATEEGPDGG